MLYIYLFEILRTVIIIESVCLIERSKFITFYLWNYIKITVKVLVKYWKISYLVSNVSKFHRVFPFLCKYIIKQIILWFIASIYLKKRKKGYDKWFHLMFLKDKNVKLIRMEIFFQLRLDIIQRKITINIVYLDVKEIARFSRYFLRNWENNIRARAPRRE